MPLPVNPLLLRIWRDVPFPAWLRYVFLRVLNPSFMVGAMALIQDEHGRILVLEHTYRRAIPWGLPGGWLKHAESPEGWAGARGVRGDRLAHVGRHAAGSRLLGPRAARLAVSLHGRERHLSTPPTRPPATSGERADQLARAPAQSGAALLRKAGVLRHALNRLAVQVPPRGAPYNRWALGPWSGVPMSTGAVGATLSGRR